MFSAGVGQTALDNLGPDDHDPNGLFTRKLLGLINEEGLELHSMVLRLRKEVQVAALTADHEQFLGYYDQLNGEFYFHPPSTQSSAKNPCDLLVDPDATQEAVLASDTEPVREVLVDGETALLAGLFDVEAFARRGVRYLGLAHFSRNALCDPAMGFRASASRGLTALGCEVVDACVRLGVLVDLAHINRRGFFDVIAHAADDVLGAVGILDDTGERFLDFA